MGVAMQMWVTEWVMGSVYPRSFIDSK